MRPLIYPLLPCAFLLSPCQGELLFEETFAYPAGGLAGNTNPLVNVPWTDINGGSENNTVSETGLISSVPVIATIANGGGGILQTANGRSTINLSSVPAIDTPAEGSTLYISFLQQFGDDSPENSKILEFWNESTAAASTIFSYGKDTRDGTPELGLTVRKLQPNFIPLATPDGSLTTETNLVVIRVDYGIAAEPDGIRFYLNPGISEPETATSTADNSTANFDLTFDRIGFGSFQGGTMALDAIRIATTYEEALRANDTDGDGIPDDYEMANGLNFEIDDANLDADANGGADGLTNLEEFRNQTDPQDSDSDDDGINDGDEVNGTLNPFASAEPGTSATSAPGLRTDPNTEDSDGDGILDLEEVTAGEDTFVTNPNQSDTDDDELPDSFEVAGGIDPTNASGINGEDGDPDFDELTNFEEFELGTSPTNADTDEDGYSDFAEDRFGEFGNSETTGTDPTNNDTDGDGLLDGLENPETGVLGGPIHRSDPNRADTDLDGISDSQEVADGTDPTDASSVIIPEITLLSIAPFENSDFENPNIASGESRDFPSWNAENTRTIETAGFLGGRFSASAGEASQVGNAFFRDVNPNSFLAQDLRGTTDLNSELHSLIGLELIGETVSLRLRIGIEAFASGAFANAHGIVEIGLRNKAIGPNEAIWRQSEVLYTGSEAEALAAGITTTIDRFLDLEETNVNGAAVNYETSYVIQDIPSARGSMIEFAITVDQVESGDQGRALFDDIDVVLGEFPRPQTPPTLSNLALDGTGFSATATNLDPAITYEFRRATDFTTGFGETIGAPFSSVDGTMMLNDPSPPLGTRAFYRVEEVQEP